MPSSSRLQLSHTQSTSSRRRTPAVVADGRDVLVVQVDRVHQLAVDVQLELPVGGVADPHRPRAAVAVQVVELLLGQVGPAVDAVHELQRARRRADSRSCQRAFSQSMKRAASSVKPMRSRAYSVNAASRIQV